MINAGLHIFVVQELRVEPACDLIFVGVEEALGSYAHGGADDLFSGGVRAEDVADDAFDVVGTWADELFDDGLEGRGGLDEFMGDEGGMPVGAGGGAEVLEDVGDIGA